MYWHFWVTYVLAVLSYRLDILDFTYYLKMHEDL